MVVVVGRWSDGVQGCGVPHFWLRARGAAAVWCYNSAHLGVSTVWDRTFFCLRARGGGGPIFVCAAVVWWIILRIWDIFLVAC